MGLLSGVFGGAAVPAVEAIGTIVDGLFTSDEERLDREAVLARLAQRPALIQAEINRIEAQHRSVFVAGWRPFIGWVCGAGLAWAFLGHAIFEWAAALWWPGVVAPNIVTDHLFELVLSMLGLGGLRTFEKLRGRAK